MSSLTKQRLGRALTWAGALILGAIFLIAGAGKLIPHPMYLENYSHWGLPIGLIFIVGLIELGAAFLIVVPSLSWIGSILLSIDMVGATAIHLINSEGKMAMLTLTLLAIALAVGWSRRKYMSYFVSSIKGNNCPEPGAC